MPEKIDYSFHKFNQVKFSFFPKIISKVCEDLNKKLTSSMTDSCFLRVENQVFQSIQSKELFRVANGCISYDAFSILLLDNFKSFRIHLDKNRFNTRKVETFDSS